MCEDGKREWERKEEGPGFIAWVSKRRYYDYTLEGEEAVEGGHKGEECWDDGGGEEGHGWTAQTDCPALLTFGSQLAAVSLYRQISIRLMWPAPAVAGPKCTCLLG